MVWLAPWFRESKPFQSISPSKPIFIFNQQKPKKGYLRKDQGLRGLIMAPEKDACVIEKEDKLATEVRIGNPAVVGLAGFAMSTFLLQVVNLGWMAVGPVVWVMFFFGGMAELIAGFLEFKTGNNFGFCIFTGFGTFWICLGFMVMLGSRPDGSGLPGLRTQKRAALVPLGLLPLRLYVFHPLPLKPIRYWL